MRRGSVKKVRELNTRHRESWTHRESGIKEQICLWDNSKTNFESDFAGLHGPTPKKKHHFPENKKTHS